MAVLGLPCCTGFSPCGEQGLLSSCGVKASPCGGFSWCRAQALGHTGSVAEAPRLWGTDSVAVHGFNCTTACGIFPDQGLSLCLLHWQADSFTSESPGKPKLHLIGGKTESQGQVSKHHSEHRTPADFRPATPMRLERSTLQDAADLRPCKESGAQGRRRGWQRLKGGSVLGLVWVAPQPPAWTPPLPAQVGGRGQKASPRGKVAAC